MYPINNTPVDNPTKTILVAYFANVSEGHVILDNNCGITLLHGNYCSKKINKDGAFGTQYHSF
jgi:hypothetical protein